MLTVRGYIVLCIADFMKINEKFDRVYKYFPLFYSADRKNRGIYAS